MFDFGKIGRHYPYDILPTSCDCAHLQRISFCAWICGLHFGDEELQGAEYFQDGRRRAGWRAADSRSCRNMRDLDRVARQVVCAKVYEKL